MEQDNRKNEPVYSKKLRAGRRRTYFFDVRPTRSNDYYLTITESKKKYNEDGYDRHKIFLYKEDFNKFIEALSETVDHVKTELLPEYDFDEFSRRYDEEGDDYSSGSSRSSSESESSSETESDASAGDPGSEMSQRQQNIEENPDQPGTGSGTSGGSPTQDDEDLKWD